MKKLFVVAFVLSIYTFAQRVKSRSHNRYRVPTIGMKSVGQSVELLIKSSRRNRKPSKKTGKTCEAVSEGKRSVIVHVYKKHGKHILALVGKEECITQKLKFLYYIN